MIVENTSSAHKCKGIVEYEFGYPCVINHDENSKLVLKVAHALWGDECLIDQQRGIGSEDFSYFLQYVPGAMMGIGNGKEIPNHRPTYNYKDELIQRTIDIYFQIYLYRVRQFSHF